MKKIINKTANSMCNASEKVRTVAVTAWIMAAGIGVASWALKEATNSEKGGGLK